ncbi:hypothetical protein FXO37_13969 [Capsicum annuum]|nr:hypothetical protein FXO37_13969 [Capsicum annuum]
MDQHLHRVSDYNQILGISPLTSSDLQMDSGCFAHQMNHQPHVDKQCLSDEETEPEPDEDLQEQAGKKIKDAIESLGVSRSTFKRICRANGIAMWSRELQIAPQPAMATLTQSSIGVKISYNGLNVRFPLSLSSGKNDLEVEVEKRFGIQTGSFWIKYEDEDEDWILITCDEDLHHGMNTCIERGITTIKMHVG